MLPCLRCSSDSCSFNRICLTNYCVTCAEISCAEMSCAELSCAESRPLRFACYCTGFLLTFVSIVHRSMNMCTMSYESVCFVCSSLFYTGVPVEESLKWYSCCERPFSHITFWVRLRRKRIYYVINLLLPSMMFSVLTLISLTLQPGCSDRITLGLCSRELYRVAQKIGTIFVRLNYLPNVNRFSKLFHYQNQEKICNNTITKDSTTPQVCH